MALVTPYCTVAEANSYLLGHTTWEDAETADKNSALFWGRVYFDSNYSCVEFDEDTPPDEIKYANALLAEDHLQGTLIETGNETKGAVTLKRTKAGSIESETEYTASGSKASDAQDDVNQLLHDICKKINKSVKMVLRV